MGTATKGAAMSNTIEIIDSPAAVASEVIVIAAKAQGWMAWYATGSIESPYWMQMFPMDNPAGSRSRDHYRCPYPLFRTREDALEACEKALPNGGKCRVVKIEL